MIGIIWEFLKSVFSSEKELPAPGHEEPPAPLPLKTWLEIPAGVLFSNHIVLYKNCEIRKEHKKESMKAALELLRAKDRYLVVASATGVPWFVIACLHKMEASQSWKSCLHNGDPIIGTGEKTTHVPRGRGPFDTWEEAAIDAINLEWHPKSWTLGEILEFCERYNGRGYRKFGINTPYVYGYTTVYKRGLFVEDGNFDPDAIQKRPGVVAIMKCLEELGEIKVILGMDAA